MSLLIAIAAVTISGMEIDSQRLAETVSADAAVLRELRENGDVASVVRPVIVYFYGSAEAIERLEGNLGLLGWHLVNHLPSEDGPIGIAISRDQTTEPATIRLLSEAALRIEVDYDVAYEGWETSVERP